jgi:hypothetical protein
MAEHRKILMALNKIKDNAHNNLKRIIIFNRRALKIQTIFVVEEKFYFSAE